MIDENSGKSYQFQMMLIVGRLTSCQFCYDRREFWEKLPISNDVDCRLTSCQVCYDSRDFSESFTISIN